MLEELDLHSIADDQSRKVVQQLLNRLEDVLADLQAAQAEIQRLRDEIARLKGEQGQPTIKPNTPQAPPKDHSSEQERHTPQGWAKGCKTDRIPIDREDVLEVDPSRLPPDAVFKGYADVVVQDVIFPTDNVLFHKEKFYSPSQHTTYLASLPEGYHGQFGPGVKSLVLALYYGAQMSEPKVAELLRNVGIQISAGQVSNLLIKDHTVFHEEKDALYQAGLASSPWQHLDDTSTRINGRNGYCHIVCNPLYTAYFTTEAKDRLTIIDVLTNHQPRRFLVNDEALGSLEAFGLSAVRRRQAGQLPGDVLMDDATLQALLEDFIERFWTYYAQLLAYRKEPTPEKAVRLDGEFEALFSTVTGYNALDERIAKTRAKKSCLLINPAELGARARVRKRDVSFGPRTRDGAKAWDTFMTLVETATKLGVSFYHYIHDRVSGASQMPSLADLIAQRAKILNLGASWDTS